jgi:predicted NBD/HSP70 family sugar kinase
MELVNDTRVVLTLDAGGTNLVFSAMRGGREVVEPLTLPAQADHLRSCLDNVVRGFSEAKALAPAAPVAISFAFPGPADYPRGIIGDLRFGGGIVREGRLHLGDPLQRIGVGISRLGTSKAVAVGAYAFALSALDGKPA